MASELRAPMPYFGGKSRIAPDVWARLGDVPNYVEPFAGSLAVLLSRPDFSDQTETINDGDGFVSNLWRAIKHDPGAVAQWADWPVNENDLHARHLWLIGKRDDITRKLEGDPDFYDAKVAGWWLWGICCWIGSGWCSGVGPWHAVDGELVSTKDDGAKRPHLGGGSQGIHRQLPHLGDDGQGIHRQLPHLGDDGRGIHRQLPHLGNDGQGLCAEWAEHLRGMMQALSDRLRRVRVCSGDWARICGDAPTIRHGITGVFLDPPYSFDERTADLYAHDTDVSADVRKWAIERGNDPMFRIALCGYDGEHEMPADWEALHWKAHGGYGSQGEVRGRENAEREVVWFSPHCLKPDRAQQATMFGFLEPT